MEGAAISTAAARFRAPIPPLGASGGRTAGLCLVGWGPRFPTSGPGRPYRKPGSVRAQQDYDVGIRTKLSQDPKKIIPSFSKEGTKNVHSSGIYNYLRFPINGQRTSIPVSESKDKNATLSPFGDSLANSVEVKQWESGYSFDDIAASQGIRIRRRPPRVESHFESEANAPRNILEEIIWTKEMEVKQLKQKKPLDELKNYIDDAPPARDFVGALRASYTRTGLPALIAEVKKASPSRGVLREDFDPVHIAKAYEAGGAACISVLTDEKFFKGSFENLEAIRSAGVKCPLLCKEFVIDAWQIYYARSKGADAILLIAAVLTDLDIKYMTKICRTLGLSALIEVHDERELDRVLGIDGVQLIGINNRNLETFEVDISNTKKLLEGERGETIHCRDIIVVGESGLFAPWDIAYVQESGVKAVLVGESLVTQEDPKKGIAGLFGKEISV